MSHRIYKFSNGTTVVHETKPTFNNARPTFNKEKEQNQHLIMQRALQSKRSLSIFVVRKQRYSKLNT